MKKTAICITALVCLAVMTAMFSCAKPKVLPTAFLGKWKGDVSMFEKDSKIREMITNEKSQESLNIIIQAFESLTVILSDDTFSIDMALAATGEKSSNKKFKYRVTEVTADGNEAVIIDKDKGATNGRYRLKLIDNDHISMINIINQNNPLETLLKRASQ
jgi:hypothetical protein